HAISNAGVDVLLTSTLVKSTAGVRAQQLSHLCVRGITRGRGVGRRLLDEARRLAAEAGKPLRLVAPDGHLESLALAARHGLPLDSL
ncbi:PanM family protein, partial [Pseudomonas aeruginosa]|uniref:PanM family protein n=1 Tax=Pseudomonas aeruginosa TaxID=287 RepID=UPI0021AB46AD